MEVEWFWSAAGFVSAWWGNRLGIHLFPSPRFWQWGRKREWFDGNIDSFGLGPLLLVVWDDIEDADRGQEGGG